MIAALAATAALIIVSSRGEVMAWAISAGDLDIQPEIERSCRHGYLAGGDVVDAGLGDRADALELDAAGGFEPGAALVEIDGTLQHRVVHVVEQNDPGAGV